jgi:hypothetical protein
MSMVSRTHSLPHPLQPAPPEPEALAQPQPRPGTLAHELAGRREPGSQSLSAVDRVLRSGLPLLTREQRATPSDRFEPGASSSRSLPSQPARDVVLDIDRLAASAGLPPPGAPSATAQERIRSALRDIEFSAPAGPQREAQEALEARYIDWAAGVVAAREKVFGNGRYSIDSDRRIQIGEAVLPALYDGVRQFLSSSSRSPVASALATAVGPRFSGHDSAGTRVNQGELNNAYDPALIGGAVGGATALTMDSTLLSAMDRRARLANFPQFKPVDLQALVPDPGPVQLRIVGGKKEYREPLTDQSGPAASPNDPTLVGLQEAAEQQRRKLATAQEVLQAQGWGLLAQPLVTGAANVLRRYLMPAQSLLQAGPVAAGSVLASGSAGAITRFGLGLLKAPAYADIDNLVGGKQRVNLFSTQLPQPEVRAATWSDIGNLPRRAGETLVEAGALARHYLSGPWRDKSFVPSGKEVRERVGDIAHAVAANTLAAVFSTATGPLLAQLMRNGASAALPGESQQSPAYLLQQFGQSATNDFVWQSARPAFRGTAFDLAASLDNWRDDREVRLRQTALQAQGDVPHLAEKLLATRQVQQDPRLQRALRDLQELRGDEVDTVKLQRALGDVAHHARQAGDAAANVGPLMRRIETALQSMEQREASLRWRAPAHRRDAASPTPN